MQAVVQEIMSVARIASGRLELSSGPIRVAQLIKTIVEAFAEVIANRQITISVDGLDYLPFIFGDGEHIRTAISNLIENGIKYTPDGGRILITGYTKREGIVIAIKDSGIGIPVEEQEQIFQQFYTLGNVDNHSTSKSAFEGGGMGLGLAIASGIIEAHNGRIWVESAGEDRVNFPGSTFFIWLPVGEPKDDELFAK